VDQRDEKEAEEVTKFKEGDYVVSLATDRSGGHKGCVVEEYSDGFYVSFLSTFKNGYEYRPNTNCWWVQEDELRMVEPGEEYDGGVAYYVTTRLHLKDHHHDQDCK
jgi:hypothetical protein